MRSGCGNPEQLARGAAALADFATPALTLSGVDVVHAACEVAQAGIDALLPPGLHPTTPPVVSWIVWRCPQSPWGAFAFWQARLSCRSGVRPRGLLLAAGADSADAAAALAGGWGFPIGSVGPVELARHYDEVRARVGGEATALELVLRRPEPLTPADFQPIAGVHLARTPVGLRLVQVETDLAIERIERGALEVARLDAARCAKPGVAPSWPIAACWMRADLTLARLRFASRPDVPAFVGTERVG
jgi:hypothetical protein